MLWMSLPWQSASCHAEIGSRAQLTDQLQEYSQWFDSPSDSSVKSHEDWSGDLLLLGDTRLINILMRDKIGNCIRVFCVTCQWKAEGRFEGKLDRELKLQAVLLKTKEHLALSCILRLRRVWQRSLSLVAGRSSFHQQGSDGTWGIWAFLYLFIFIFSPCISGPVHKLIAQALVLASF